MDLSDSTVRRRVNKRFRDQGDPLKVCSECFEVKEHREFYAASKSSDGRTTCCKECDKAATSAWAKAHPARRAAYNRQWRDENPEYGQEWTRRNRDRRQADQRRWRAAHPDKVLAASRYRKAVKKAATVERVTARDLRDDWEEYDLYECFFCGGSLVDGYEVEHFYALSSGGPHALFNLLPSCMPCNRGAGGKGTKEPWGYLRQSLAEQGTDLDAAIAGLEAIAARRR